MRRALTALLCTAALAALAPAPASALELTDFDVSFHGPPPPGSEPGAVGSAQLQAGSHPYAIKVVFDTETIEKEGVELPSEAAKNLELGQIEGLAGVPRAVPPCSTAQFLRQDLDTGPLNLAECPDAAAIGQAAVEIGEGTGEKAVNKAPLYSLAPPPGSAAKLGFWALGVPVTIEVGLNPDPPYNIRATTRNISQALEFFGAETTIWGNPASPAHDEERGACYQGGKSCPAGVEELAFLTMPRACGEPLASTWAASSWQFPDHFDRGSSLTHDDEGNPRGIGGCGALGFAPRIDAAPTTRSAESPSGLDFTLAIEDPGIADPAVGADSDMRRARVTLPEGVTINPSQAEGLDTCEEDELAEEGALTPAGQGCPSESKIGTVEATSPLEAQKTFRGEVFVATPYENPFDSLIALYMTVQEPELGVGIRLAGKVEPDPETGRLIATFGDPNSDDPAFRELPQLPISRFRVRLREGGRSPLVTPPTCGTYEIEAELTPYASSGAYRADSSFEIGSGPGGAPCPPGAPPFLPGFAAGALNNAAGAHSPYLLRLTRRDGDQDIVRFDATLPPGVTAKLAGVPWCPEAAIARARGRDGEDELRDPSCPLASQIGSVQGGAGVGSQLTYVPGKVYLAGPVGGAPISVVGIVPAVAGPFDVGTIVVRQALDLDPITGQAKVVSAASDPLPHILAGVPLKVRDIQVSVDRPNFTLNPTNCNPMAVLAGIWGGGTDVFSPHDDFPVLRQARFQAASCASLGFEPKLAIKLRGGVKRGAHPALRAHVVPRPGDANFSRAVVTLPRSAFLEQGHIRTICTRVQFAVPPGHGAHCPPGARYGFARAWSPLLDGPVTGPVYLRSSNNNLPDLVAALTGPPSARVQIELSARIDSVKGGIRSTFTGIPDLPVSRFLLDMQGGKKGLIVNSRHLCHKPGRNRAKANLRGQNGRFSRTKPRVVATTCQKRHKAKRKRAKRSALHSAHGLEREAGR